MGKVNLAPGFFWTVAVRARYTSPLDSSGQPRMGKVNLVADFIWLTLLCGGGVPCPGFIWDAECLF